MKGMEWEEFCEFGDDSDAEHYEAVCHLSCSWQWIGHGGNPVDLRKAPIQHIQHLAEWMRGQDLPYVKLKQYEYVQRRVRRNEAWLNYALEILHSKHLGDKNGKNITES